MLKANDGRMTDNRPWRKLTWSKAPGELIIQSICGKIYISTQAGEIKVRN